MKPYCLERFPCSIIKRFTTLNLGYQDLVLLAFFPSHQLDAPETPVVALRAVE
jgi:hypothetical protein